LEGVEAEADIWAVYWLVLDCVIDRWGGFVEKGNWVRDGEDGERGGEDTELYDLPDLRPGRGHGCPAPVFVGEAVGMRC